MIVRIWRGETLADQSEAYFNYLEQTGLKQYRSTPGNCGVITMRRLLGDRAEFLLLSFWDSWSAIKGFAGEAVEMAVYYPEDEKFLIQKEPLVSHFEMLPGSSLQM